MYLDLSRGHAPASTQKAPIENAPFRPPFSLRASSTPRVGTPSSQAIGAPPRDSSPFPPAASALPWDGPPSFQAAGSPPLVNSPFPQAIGAPPLVNSPFPQAVGAPPWGSLPFFQVGLTPCSDSIIFLDMTENEASANTISQNEVSKHTPTYLYSEIHS